MSSISDYEAAQAEEQSKAAEVRHVELAAPIAEELHHTHEAVADLNFGVEYEMERNPAAPPVDFAENPLIVDQQSSTRLDALRTIR